MERGDEYIDELKNAARDEECDLYENIFNENIEDIKTWEHDWIWEGYSSSYHVEAKMFVTHKELKPYLEFLFLINLSFHDLFLLGLARNDIIISEDWESDLDETITERLDLAKSEEEKEIVMKRGKLFREKQKK